MAEEKVKRITRNAARCRVCKQVIESKHVHDYVSCACGAIAVDGGRSYLRRVGEPANFEEDLSEFTTEPLPEKTQAQKQAEENRLWVLLQGLYDKNSI